MHDRITCKGCSSCMRNHRYWYINSIALNSYFIAILSWVYNLYVKATTYPSIPNASNSEQLFNCEAFSTGWMILMVSNAVSWMYHRIIILIIIYGHIRTHIHYIHNVIILSTKVVAIFETIISHTLNICMNNSPSKYTHNVIILIGYFDGICSYFSPAVTSTSPTTATARRAPRKTDICSPSGSSAPVSCQWRENDWLVVSTCSTHLKKWVSHLGGLWPIYICIHVYTITCTHTCACASNCSWYCIPVAVP